MAVLKFQTKLFVYFIVLVAISLALTSTLLLSYLNSELSSSVYSNFKQKSQEAAVNIDRILDNSFTGIQTIGENPILKSSGFSNEEKLEILNIMQSAYPTFDEITLSDSDGNVIVSTDSNFKKEWAEKHFLNVLLGETIVSDVQKISESKTVLFILSPVFDANKNVVSILTAQIPMNAIWDVTDKTKIGNTGFIFIADNSGTVIAHPNKIFILKESPYSFNVDELLPSGNIDFNDIGGEELTSGYSKLSEEPDYKRGEWIIFAVQTKSEAFTVIKDVSDRFILIAILSFVIAAAIGFVFAKHTFKPIRELHKGVKAILTGDLNYDFLIRTGDEIEEIADSVKEMIKMIKQKEILERLKSDLHDKVKESEKLNKLLVGRESEIKRLKNIVGKLKKRKG